MEIASFLVDLIPPFSVMSIQLIRSLILARHSKTVSMPLTSTRRSRMGCQEKRDVTPAMLILRLPMIYLSSIARILKRTVEIHDLTSDIPHTPHKAYLETS